MLALISGVLLALAFPKLSWDWLAWIALVPLFVVLGKAKGWKESLLYGFLFGFFFFGIHLFWLGSLFRFVGWWVVLAWGAFTLFQTLFILIFVALLRLIRSKGTSYAVLAALLWVLVEWCRTWGPFGVSLGGIGYSQVSLLPLIQIASLTSVYGVSFLVVLVNTAMANMFLEPAPTLRRGGPIIFVLLLLVVTYGYGLFELRGNREACGERTLKLALIQPNIDQKDKLDPAKVMPTLEIFERITRQVAREKPDIIVWPETAIFSYLLRDEPLYRRIKSLARDSKAWLIFGTPHYEGGKAYNSIVSISPGGRVVSRYDKQHLVPFGEYLPFRKILYPLLSGVGYFDQEYSSNPQPNLISAGKIKIAAVICFESTIPDLIRRRVKEDTDFILALTNDAWFGDSAAPYFHLDTGIFRAIENRKYFVQVGNTGISAVIDPFGRVLKRTRINQQEILTFEIPLS